MLIFLRALRSQELRALLASDAVRGGGIPVLVCLNKCDLRDSLATADALHALAVPPDTRVLRCSVTHGTGLVDLAAWLASSV